MLCFLNGQSLESPATSLPPLPFSPISVWFVFCETDSYSVPRLTSNIPTWCFPPLCCVGGRHHHALTCISFWCSTQIALILLLFLSWHWKVTHWTTYTSVMFSLKQSGKLGRNVITNTWLYLWCSKMKGRSKEKRQWRKELEQVSLIGKYVWKLWGRDFRDIYDYEY